MRSARLFAVIICAALIFCACGTRIEPPNIVSGPVVTDAPPVKPAYPISFDNENFESAPASVASLSPAITEILYDIGAADKLVAISDYCDYPMGVAGTPVIGSPARPDIDAIIALKPELLITQSPMASRDVLTLKQEGIRVLEMAAPSSYAELCDAYIKLAMIFYGAVDFTDIAYPVLERLDSQMSAAQELGVSKSFVVVEAESPDGLMLSHGDTLCSEMLSVFGGNLWEDSERYTATDDELFILAPEVVFYARGLDRDDIEEVFPYSQLIEIDLERFERPTVRLSQVISECADKLG